MGETNQALEEAARAATQGPWRTNYERVWAVGYRVASCDWDLSGARPMEQCFKDARYISLANPAAILDLIAQSRADKARIAELEGARDEAVKDRNAHAEHVRRVATEATDGFEALDLLDAAWEATGYLKNRGRLTLAEQVSSIVREREDAEARAQAAESALAERDQALAAAVEALGGIEPYLDAIVCYASSMDEHEPNRLAFNVSAALARLRPDREEGK